MPPVSKVTPLPTRPSGLAVAAALVAQDDQLRLLGAALARPRPGRPSPSSAICSRPSTSQLTDVVLVGDLLGAAGQVGGGDDVGGQVLELAGAVLGLGADAGGLDGLGEAAVAEQRQLLEPLGAGRRRPCST